MRSTIITLCFVFILIPVHAKADFILGVTTHLLEQNAEKNVQIVRDIGLNSIRDEIKWSAVEKVKGNMIIPQKSGLYMQKSSESNISPLVVLDYGNNFYDGGKKPVSTVGIAAFARYAGFSSKQLQGQVKFFEIWNEWDHHSAEPVSAESYFEIVKAAALAIKQNNKNAIVLAGAATTAGIRNGWVEKLVQLGALKYVDGISIHPYIHCDRDKSPEVWIKFVSETSAQLQKANSGKIVPLYITEMGWPNDNGACGTAPDKAAQYLARALLLVRTLPEVKGFWWYDLKNDGLRIDEREHNYGLVGYDYAPKPAFAYLRDITPIILVGRDFARVQVPPGIVLVAITDGKGNKSFAIWSENGGEKKVNISIAGHRDTSPFLLKIGDGKSARIPLKQNVIEVTIDGTPQLFTGVQSLQINGIAS